MVNQAGKLWPMILFVLLAAASVGATNLRIGWLEKRADAQQAELNQSRAQHQEVSNAVIGMGKDIGYIKETLQKMERRAGE